MEYTKEDLEREINATREVYDELKSKLSTLIEDLDRKATTDSLTEEDVEFIEGTSAKLTSATEHLKEIRNIIMNGDERNENKSGVEQNN